MQLSQHKNHTSLFFYIVLFVFLTIAPSYSRSILFFFALEQDWKAFQDELGITSISRSLGGSTIFSASFRGDSISAVKMQAGPVETAISSSLLLAVRSADIALSAGPVGGLSLKVAPRDVGLVADVIAWQKSGGVELGDEVRGRRIRWERWQGIYPERRLFAVASGEVFVGTQELRQQIHEQTGADVVDMNLFGLVSALARFGVPSLHVRIVSDLADENAAEDFRHFVESYQGDLGRSLGRFVRDMPPDKTSPASYPEFEELLLPGDK